MNANEVENQTEYIIYIKRALWNAVNREYLLMIINI